MGADNPDNLYESAPLLSSSNYILKGTRGTVKYLSIGTQLGHYGKRLGMPPLSFLDSSQFQYKQSIPKSFEENAYDLEQDKYFEIIISAQEISQEILDRNQWNYLKLDGQEDGTLIVRQTFGRRDIERKAVIRLEPFDIELELKENDGRSARDRVSSGGGVPSRVMGRKVERPRPLTPIEVDEALSSASKLVVGAALMFSNWGNRMRASTEHINKLPVKVDQTEYVCF